MSKSTKLLLITAFIITLIQRIFSNHNNLIYTGTTKTLVLLDDWNYLNTHSMFWDQLRAINFNLEFKMIEDPDIKLTYFDQYIYSNIIYFAPTYNEMMTLKSDYGIKLENLLKFFDEGHDIMFFGSSNSGGYIRKAVNEFGVDFDDYETTVKDSVYMHNYKEYLNTDLLELKNNEIVVTKNAINIPAVSKLPKGFILFEGIGMDVDHHNQYVFPILKADENAYSINTESGEIISNGEKIKLVTGYQARNNRRVVISGSINLCSNQFYFLSSLDGTNPSGSPNAVFCQDILNWNFQRTGVLKYENIRHQRKTDGVALSTYRIKDELEYMIDIYEYDYKTKSWKPYLTDDLQLEFVMMNPYYINQMRLLSSSKPTYYNSFRAPEKFGVFKFIIDYKRLGYSYLDISTKVPLRPYNHDEYPRYLPAAYPYYISVFAVLIAFVIFAIAFIYGKNQKDYTIE